MKLLIGSRSRNHAYARLLLAELARCGIDEFFVCPGSQSSPLVLALAEQSSVSVTTHFDERGACFAALGYGRASGRPAVVICTSGSALANLYPAVVEASEAEVPLILLTADREERLQDVGANQTLNQVGFFSRFVRWEHQLTSSATPSITSMLTAIDHAVAQSGAGGAVHLNVRFPRPLLSTPSTARGKEVFLPEEWMLPHELGQLNRWADSNLPFTRCHSPENFPSPAQISSVLEKMAQARRGLVVVGSLPSTTDCAAIGALVNELKWPVLADVTSQLRFGPWVRSELMQAHAHWYCRQPHFASRVEPDFILQLGAQPVQLLNSVVEFLDGVVAERVLVANSARRQDPAGVVTERVVCDPALFCRQVLPGLATQRSRLNDEFQQAEQLCREVVLSSDSVALSEIAVVRSVVDEMPNGHGLYLGNSLPIRLFSWIAPPVEKTASVFCNRGLSGIDGTLASAFGALRADERRALTVVLGDLSFLHDANSLALLRQLDRPLVVVVLNNFGGGIFSAVYDQSLGKRFLDMTVAPHTIEFSKLSSSFGICYERPLDMIEFVESYRAALVRTAATVIEVQTSQIASVQGICELEQETQAALARLLAH